MADDNPIPLYIQLVESGIFKHNGKDDHVPRDLKERKKDLTENQKNRMETKVNEIIEHLRSTKDNDTSNILDLSGFSAAANRKSEAEKLSIFEQVCNARKETDLREEISNKLREQKTEEKAEEEKTEEEKAEEEKEEEEKTEEEKAEEEKAEEKKAEEEKAEKNKTTAKKETASEPEGESEEDVPRPSVPPPVGLVPETPETSETPGLYSTKPRDAERFWKYKIAKIGDIAILFERLTKSQRENEYISHYGRQIRVFDVDKKRESFQYQLVRKNELPRALVKKWNMLKRAFTLCAEDKRAFAPLVFRVSERKYPKNETLKYIFMIFPYQVKQGDRNKAFRTTPTEVIAMFGDSTDYRPVLLSHLYQHEGRDEMEPIINAISDRDGQPVPRDWTPKTITYENTASHTYRGGASRKAISLGQKLEDVASARNPIPRISSSPSPGIIRVSRTPEPGRRTQSPSIGSSPGAERNHDIENIYATLDEHDQKFSSLSQKVDGLEKNFHSMDNKLDLILRRLGQA